jgi:predicted alpha/beta hydrolase
MIGLGADMPMGVYRGWKRWVSYRRNFFDVPEMAHEAGIAARVSIPVAAANSVDDVWALPRSRDAIMSGYASIDVTAIDIVPTERRLGPIGHTGYFREAAMPLWADALEWLDTHRDRGLSTA